MPTNEAIISKRKEILAKLLAQENITIEFHNVDTAMFHVNTRLLILPNMKDGLSQELYNLFIGHEVGHALFTPKTWINNDLTFPSSISDKDKQEAIEKNLKNIIEDIRIEKKIQLKYPGLRYDFVTGYKELYAKDFFGTSKKDITEFGFLDRLNIKAKCGVNVDVPFTPDEQKMVDQCFAISTWEDTVEVAQKILDFVVQKNTTDYSGHKDITDSSGKKGNKEKFPPLPGRNPDEYDDVVDRVKKKEKPFDPNEPAEHSNVQVSVRNNEPKDIEKDLENETNSNLEEALKNLITDMQKNEIITYKIPELNLKNIIVPVQDFSRSLEKSITDANVNKHDAGIYYSNYRTENRAVIKYLIKEFELYKNAQELKKEQTAKTGVIDLKKLARYQLTTDLFKKNIMTVGGKSHGLQIFLDWSGSMDSYLAYCLIQIFCITDFCRALSIPFEVYAFVTGVRSDLIDKNKDFKFFQSQEPSHLDLHKFHLVNMLSSKQSHLDYVNTQKNFLYCFNNHYHPNQKGNVDNEYMWTSSTPLNNAIVAAMQLVPQFKKDNNLEIVNTIFITDGSSDTTTQYFNPTDVSSRITGNPVSTSYLVDPVTMNYEKLGRVYDYPDGGCFMTKELLELLQKRTQCNVIGFFLTAMDFNNIKSIYKNPNNIQTDDIWRNNGYCIQYGVGYTVHYCIHINNLKILNKSLKNVEVSKYGSKKDKLRTIEAEWMKNIQTNLRNRAMLTNFIQHIS